LNNNLALEINKNHGSVNNFKFYNQLEYKGTTYKINSFLGLDKNNFMLFKIKQFLIHKINVSEVYVNCEKIEVEYNCHLRSFIVKNPLRNYIFNLADFVTPPFMYIPLIMTLKS